mmetsp:Transcript_31237/g.36444  ORF Transcript_31237/g.36444 Transcript_31237/m.36444 type:complete len:493 (+) Transcript_31237:112-1590(+)
MRKDLLTSEGVTTLPSLVKEDEIIDEKQKCLQNDDLSIDAPQSTKPKDQSLQHIEDANESSMHSIDISENFQTFFKQSDDASIESLPLPVQSRKYTCCQIMCNRIMLFISNIWGWIRDPYGAYVDFMYHLFDLTFGMLMFYFATFFYIQSIIFTILIYVVGLFEPDCIIFDGKHLDEMTRWFDASWTLSWTTFSTVGYGNTAPALSDVGNSETMHDVDRCIAINMLLMIVSFVGVVYTGAAGAILFSKVEKIKGEGQVSFSDPCVIRFGSGLGAEADSDEAEAEEEQNQNMIPCPVLEFRLLNHNHKSSGGVIANAELHCLASVEDETGNDLGTTERPSKKPRWKMIIDHDNRVNLPRRLFINMELTNGDHPFFRRCWTATHIIDDKSPLIRKKMRERIRKNHGFWPKKCNKAEDIKRQLIFKQIIVNFTGVSKRTSAQVHAQRVYDACDVIVGYQFVNVLHKTEDDVVEVHDGYLNVITGQNGNDKGEELE